MTYKYVIDLGGAVYYNEENQLYIPTRSRRVFLYDYTQLCIF